MLKVTSLFFLLSLTGQVWTYYKSFNDFPLTIDAGNYVIHATLTDLSSDEKYFLEEYIHSNVLTNGKISISSSVLSSSIDVHYGASSVDQRLVIQDYDCNLVTYKTKWKQKITGITEPLLNHILLVGPSLIYRLKHQTLVWVKRDDAAIRGTMMKSASTLIGANDLNITIYYKDSYNPDLGILQPSRIQFTGTDPSDDTFTLKQNLILDIYLQTNTDQELDKIVIPKPGIGCPVAFQSVSSHDKVHFIVEGGSVHFISNENINGPTKSTTRNEIYVDETNQLSSIKTTSLGITTEAIYDYTLGLIYVRQSNGGCLVSPMGLNSFVARGNDPYAILKTDLQFFIVTAKSYLGQTWFKNQPGFSADVWESVAYNVTTASGQYDKVVTTIYTVDAKPGDTTYRVIPVGRTINAYKKGSTGLYSLIETTTNYYYDFGEKISREDYEERFRISDCHPKDQKTLAIQFDCKSGNCNYAVEKFTYDFQDKVRKAIVNTGTISGTRIGNIDIELTTNTTKAYVTFLDFPDLSIGFKASYFYLPSDVVKTGSRSTAASSRDCLRQNAVASNFEAVAYCDNENICTRINKIENLVEDKKNGIGCTMYYIPLKNLYRYNRESPLDKIQSELKSKSIGFYFYDSNNLVQYSVSRVDEVVEPENESRQLFVIENYASKFVEDGTDTIMATSASNLASCYQACANFDDNDCETFSFCQRGDAVECLLSTSVYPNVTDKRVYDSNCQIYRKNRLQDYIKIENREFINPTSIAIDGWIDDCADLCSQSDECFSFQISLGTCRFGGYYTDSSTKYSEDSDIYMPKLAQKFARTGNMIVIEIFHTELSLTLDQCAALCYDLTSSDGDGCESFNYCPKGRTSSSCSLTQYSVKDSLVRTTDSNTCTNYELKSNDGEARIKQNLNPNVSISKQTSGVEAFGIIVLFIGIGLVVGLMGTFIINKSRSIVVNIISSERDSFTWSRYTNDEDTEEIQIAINASE